MKLKHKFNKWVISKIEELRQYFIDDVDVKSFKGFMRTVGITISLLLLIIYKTLFITKHYKG